MEPRISYRSAVVLAAVTLGLTIIGCKAQQLTETGGKVAFLYDEPEGCEHLGVVIGRGGGISGAYSKPSVNQESAENDARNQAAKLGATHILLHPEEVSQGDGRGPDYQDTQPELAHGSGTGSTITVSATAYRCALDAPPSKNAMSIQTGSAFVAVSAPTSISLAPLGELKNISVFVRMPLPSGTGMSEDRALLVEDPAEIQQVADSLQRVEEDPLKFIPTHRVELVGELGTQSLLYGFGYVQYATKEYRLTDGDFEEILKLRAEPKGPEVEMEAPASAPAIPTEAP